MWQDIKNIYHLLRAVGENVWFGFPARHLTVVGVTGTDGKTTTVNLIYHILKTANLNPSMISSIGAVITGQNYDLEFHRTTPTSGDLQKFFKIAKKEATKFLILEITSHALDQYRAWGINFKVGVITNITNEHLDYHKTYENYVKSKLNLLKNVQIAILNKDDTSYEIILTLKSKLSNKKVITYGMKSYSDVNPDNFPLNLKIPGEFNKYNVLAAVSACRALDIDEKFIKRGVETFKLPIGRMEEVYKNDFTVMIDFAHTPNSFEQLLSSVKPGVKNRLIHVFGTAGKRDFAKRPIMGEVSSKYADIIILTAEDPRDEPVEKINSQIEKGISGNFELQNYKTFKNSEKRRMYLKINDRKEAIDFAVSIAKKGDFIVATGKSHERSMNYGNGEEPWDEFKVVKTAIKNKNYE